MAVVFSFSEKGVWACASRHFSFSHFHKLHHPCFTGTYQHPTSFAARFTTPTTTIIVIISIHVTFFLLAPVDDVRVVVVVVGSKAWNFGTQEGPQLSNDGKQRIYFQQIRHLLPSFLSLLYEMQGSIRFYQNSANRLQLRITTVPIHFRNNIFK